MKNRYKDKAELGKLLFAFTCFFPYYQMLTMLRNICWVTIRLVKFTQ